MKILSDGSVIQSALSYEQHTRAKEIFRMDFALKKGVVTTIYYPDEEANLSKSFIEYDVVVVEERADGSASTVVYSHCQVMDIFGTANNFSYFTLQPSSSKDKEVYKNGAQVLLLAINGNASGGRGVIIGGLPYPPEKTPSKNDGQFYNWQFNGINIKIDKEGQYSLTFNTPIDVNRKKKDEKAAGTKIEIFKDGKMKLSDNEKQSWEIDRVNQKSVWTNGAESIIIDKKNKKIELISSGEVNEKISKQKTIKTGSDHKIDAGGSIEEQAGKDIKVEAKSNIIEKAGSNWQFEAGGNITIKAGGNVTVQGSGQAQFKGSMNMIGDGSVPAAGVGISQCFGIGNLGAPVMSNIITGSATVFIGS